MLRMTHCITDADAVEHFEFVDDMEGVVECAHCFHSIDCFKAGCFQVQPLCMHTMKACNLTISDPLCYHHCKATWEELGMTTVNSGILHEKHCTLEKDVNPFTEHSRNTATKYQQGRRGKEQWEEHFCTQLGSKREFNYAYAHLQNYGLWMPDRKDRAKLTQMTGRTLAKQCHHWKLNIREDNNI